MSRSVALQLLQSLIPGLRSEGFEAAEPSGKQYHWESQISSGSDQLKLQVYYGKKGIKTVIQGKTNTLLYQKVQEAVSGKSSNEKTEDIEEPDYYIGSDESGKGDYFGPLVTAAVFTTPQIRKSLQKVGIRDSKQISDATIMDYYRKIVQTPGVTFSYRVVIPSLYNQLYKTCQNLNLMLTKLHIETIQDQIVASKCQVAILDQYGNAEKTAREAKSIPGLRLIQTTNAERFTGVAAASVVARKHFLDWMHSFGQRLSHPIPKGAGGDADDFAKLIYSKYGSEVLIKMVKLHFKNSEKWSGLLP